MDRRVKYLTVYVNVRLKTHSERTVWNFHDAMRYAAFVYPGKFTSRYYSGISEPYVCRVPRFIIQYEGCLSSPMSTLNLILGWAYVITRQ